MKRLPENSRGSVTGSALGFLIDLDLLAERVGQIEARLAALERQLADLVKPAVVPLTVKELSKKHPTYSEASLRWLLFHRRANGLARAVIQGRGGRLKIDEQAFLEWVAEGREAAPMPMPKGGPRRRAEASGSNRRTLR